jgi:hypothetical protein
LRPEATVSDIKQAFRRLAPLCHPDKNPGDPSACSRFIAVRAPPLRPPLLPLSPLCSLSLGLSRFRFSTKGDR